MSSATYKSMGEEGILIKYKLTTTILSLNFRHHFHENSLLSQNVHKTPFGQITGMKEKMTAKRGKRLVWQTGLAALKKVIDKKE